MLTAGLLSTFIGKRWPKLQQWQKPAWNFNWILWRAKHLLLLCNVLFLFRYFIFTFEIHTFIHIPIYLPNIILVIGWLQPFSWYKNQVDHFLDFLWPLFMYNFSIKALLGRFCGFSSHIVCAVFYFLQHTILSILSEEIFIEPLKNHWGQAYST